MKRIAALLLLLLSLTTVVVGCASMGSQGAPAGASDNMHPTQRQ